MKQPHKHAELIKAWADGEEIEFRACPEESWQLTYRPSWLPNFEYRIKSVPKPDVVVYGWISVVTHGNNTYSLQNVNLDSRLLDSDNCKFVFDGETGKLKSAEVIS